jgi:hypothetical protein
MKLIRGVGRRIQILYNKIREKSEGLNCGDEMLRKAFSICRCRCVDIFGHYLSTTFSFPSLISLLVHKARSTDFCCIAKVGYIFRTHI